MTVEIDGRHVGIGTFAGRAHPRQPAAAGSRGGRRPGLTRRAAATAATASPASQQRQQDPVAQARRAAVGQHRPPGAVQRVGRRLEVDDQRAPAAQHLDHQPAPGHARRRRPATATHGRTAGTRPAHQATASTRHGTHHHDLAARPPPAVHGEGHPGGGGPAGRQRRARAPATRAAAGGRARPGRARPGGSRASRRPARTRGRAAGPRGAACDRRRSGFVPMTVSSPPVKWSPAAYTVQPPYSTRWATRYPAPSTARPASRAPASRRRRSPASATTATTTRAAATGAYFTPSHGRAATATASGREVDRPAPAGDARRWRP